MAGLNKILLIGRLGADPEMRYSQNGKAITKFRIATDSGWGEKKTTDWHSVVTFDKVAENCAKFLTKGRMVYVEGRVSYRKWDKDDGTSQWGNLVLFADRAAADGLGQEALHRTAVDRAPLHYDSLRLHRLVLPDGGVGAAPPRLDESLLFDFRVDPTWIARPRNEGGRATIASWERNRRRSPAIAAALSYRRPLLFSIAWLQITSRS